MKVGRYQTDTLSLVSQATWVDNQAKTSTYLAPRHELLARVEGSICGGQRSCHRLLLFIGSPKAEKRAKLSSPYDIA